ncbi:hypothetical protein INT43_004548 [Umbelopsis isabellina]|uniref:Prolyl 4-hydroxylase alpha subunit domain-containing protein n=1 Tax=Mortierella isabellina TaxID=91625 RepID=A0A8H7PFU3_MORIS|nr:hypothetical protein INT43_004548 [Umbelopsis isabellina]
MEDEIDLDLFGEFTEEEQQGREARVQKLKEQLQDSIANLPQDPSQRTTAQNRLLFRQAFSPPPFIISSLLSPAECRGILDTLSHDTHWLTARHSAFATTDIAVSSVPKLASSLPGLLKSRLLETHIAPKFGFHPQLDLAFRDLFIVRYCHDAQRGLQMHTDGCLISFNVLLNARTEFDGGGTIFETLDAPIEIDQGDCVVHDAHVKHGGMDITRGTRFILVGFVDTVDTLKKDTIARSM